MSDDNTSRTQRALNIIEKRPGIRSDELAKLTGIEHKQLSSTMKYAVDQKFVVTALVKRPGLPDTTEWRLSQMVNKASDWKDWKAKHRATADKAQCATSDTAITEASQRISELESQLKAANAANVHMANRIDELEAAAKASAATFPYFEGPSATPNHKTPHGVCVPIPIDFDPDRAIDIKDAAIGYLVRVPKRKPRLVGKPERAREAAESSARQFGRADVLALVPIGTARGRKAVQVEWKEA